MELTNSEIYNAQSAFKSLMKKELPILTAYKFMVIGKEFGKQWEILEGIRMKLLHKHGTANPETNTVMATPGTPEFLAFSAEWAEVIKETVDIDVEPVEIPSNIDIAPEVLFHLEKFIKINK